MLHISYLQWNAMQFQSITLYATLKQQLGPQQDWLARLALRLHTKWSDTFRFLKKFFPLFLRAGLSILSQVSDTFFLQILADTWYDGVDSNGYRRRRHTSQFHNVIGFSLGKYFSALSKIVIAVNLLGTAIFHNKPQIMSEVTFYFLIVDSYSIFLFLILISYHRYSHCANCGLQQQSVQH